jgi:hypothetical protein
MAGETSEADSSPRQANGLHASKLRRNPGLAQDLALCGAASADNRSRHIGGRATSFTSKSGLLGKPLNVILTPPYRGRKI